MRAADVLGLISYFVKYGEIVRELTLHEISSVGGAMGFSPPGRMLRVDSEGVSVAAAAVGSVSTTIGYFAGTRIIGSVDRQGLVKGMSFGWVVPFAADLCLAGSQITPRLGRSAFIGTVTGFMGALAMDDSRSGANQG